jgi:apolipoprotein N-acyltransferase
MKTMKLLSLSKSREAFLPYLYLFIGLILFLFSNGKWTMPLLTWIAPFFLIRSVRSFEDWKGVAFSFILIVIAHSIRFKGIIPAQGILYFMIMFSGSIFIFLPYLTDRWLNKKLNTFQATLVFPIISVIAEYIVATSNGYAGSWGSLAQTQDNLVLLQLTSLTGIWGLTFIIAWTGSILNNLCNHKFEIVKIKQGLIIFLVVIFSVFLYGEIRTSFFPANSETVRIASITHDLIFNDSTNFMKNINRLQAFRNQASLIQAELLKLTSKAADYGAKIIFLHEASIMVLEEDEQALIAKACAISKNKNVYLGLSLLTVTKEFPKNPGEAKIVWINPEGNVIWDFHKAYPTPSDPIIAGDKRIKIFDTPYGRISSVICFDMDFPSFVNKAGQKEVDIMLVPANDWKEITPLHANMSKLRAIENGFSMVRCTGRGLSIATDYQGKTLCELDYYKTKEKIMISDVPIKGTNTIYAQIGDIFVWICIVGFLILLGVAFYNRRRVLNN